MLYRRFLRPLFFRCDPEWAHDQAIRWSARSQSVPGLLRCCSHVFRQSDERLRVDLAGIPLENPVGLAAGYDKSGRAVETMAALGFGFVEIGSVSASPSPGNPKPRLWRLPDDEATCVHYGLPNDGALTVKEHLERQNRSVPLGINLVNTNDGCGSRHADADTILDDYVRSASVLSASAAYLMLNLSCPNTSDGREFFDEPDHLSELLERLRPIVQGPTGVKTPVFLKVSPDGDDASIDRLLKTVDNDPLVKGFMFNLSSRRRSGLTTPQPTWIDLPGAISGKPTREWMLKKVGELYRKMDRDRYQIIAAGGVSTAEDAYRLIRQGASVVQLLTALVYEGPGVVKRINRGLIKLLDRDGIEKVTDLVGADFDNC